MTLIMLKCNWFGLQLLKRWQHEKKNMKSKTSLYVKNSVIILIGRVSEFLFGIISIILIARYLGPEKFGVFAFVRGIGIISTPIIGYGGYLVLMREFSVNKEKAPVFLSSSFILQTLLSFLVLLTATIFFIIFRETQPEIIISIYLVIIAQSVLTYYRAVSLVFFAYERVVYDSITSILIRILYLLFIVTVIFLDLKMIGFFSALIVANFIGFLIAWFFLARNFFRLKVIINIQNVYFLFKESWTLMISNIIVQGYMNINLFLLKAFSSLTQISFYQIPQRLVEPLKMIPRSIVTSVMPRFSVLGSSVETRRELISAYNTMLKYIMVCFFPFCVLAIIFAAPVISLLFGEAFSGAVTPLQISIWTIIAFFIITLSEHVLTVLKKQRVLVVSNGCCLLINLFLGIYFIPNYGAVGASMAMACGLYSLFFLNCYFISKYLGKIKLLSRAVRPIICSVIMWVFINSFDDNIHITLLIPSAMAIYVVALISFKTFTLQELELFKNYFQKIMSRFGLSKKGYI